MTATEANVAERKRARPGLAWEDRTVAREAISIDPHFHARQGNVERAHVRVLVMAIRNGAKLTPVTLWQDDAPTPRNSLVLLDGAHRLAAYKSVKWRNRIPARIVTCSRRDALLIAAEANAKDTLMLSPGEKADMAWRLVREPDAGYSKAEIARASGVSPRTVATMRSRLRTLLETGVEPSGDWRRDRMDRAEEWDGSAGDDEARRKAEVAELAKKLLDVVGRRARYDEHLVADALEAAFGYRLRFMADYLYGDVDEWASIDVSEDHGTEEDAEEPQF